MENTKSADRNDTRKKQQPAQAENPPTANRTASGQAGAKDGPAGSRPTPEASRGGHRSAARTMTVPETIHDERDDVLSVINELEDQLDRYEEMRETLQRELNSVNEELQQARNRSQELEWQVVTLQTRIDAHEQVRQEITLLEEEIADTNARANRLNEQLISANKENTRLNDQLKSTNRQLDELYSTRKERDGLKGDLKNLSAKLDQTERLHREVVEERNQINARLTDAQKSLEDIREAKHESELALQAAEDRYQESQNAHEALIERIDTLKADNKSLRAQLTHLERENSRLAEQQQFADREIASLRSANRNAEATLSDVKKVFSEVRMALCETKARSRRRVAENWPRTSTTLRGLGPVRAENGSTEQEANLEEAVTE